MLFWVSPHPAFEDGTDRGFRNVRKPQSDAGEIPKRTYATFKTRRRFEIKNHLTHFHVGTGFECWLRARPSWLKYFAVSLCRFYFPGYFLKYVKIVPHLIVSFPLLTQHFAVQRSSVRVADTVVKWTKQINIWIKCSGIIVVTSGYGEPFAGKRDLQFYELRICDWTLRVLQTGVILTVWNWWSTRVWHTRQVACSWWRGSRDSAANITEIEVIKWRRFWYKGAKNA